MNCINLRNTTIILACLFNSQLFAQDMAPEEKKLVLQAIAMKRNCVKAYPGLKEKIEARTFSGKNELEQKMKKKMDLLEISEDPYIKGQIDGASIVTYEKDLMEVGCKALAGMLP